MKNVETSICDLNYLSSFSFSETDFRNQKQMIADFNLHFTPENVDFCQNVDIHLKFS